MALDLARGHAARIQRDDLFVEPRQAPLALGNQLRLELAVAITGHIDRHFALIALDRLAAAAVAGVTATAALRCVLVIAQVVGELGFKYPLHQVLRQLLENPVLPE